VAIGDNVEVIADCTGPNEYRLHQLLWLDPSEDDLAPMRKEEAGRVQLRGQVTEYVPGTIYSVNWLLPLGGFVRMLGEEDPTAPDSFAAAPKRRRAAALLAGPLTNVLLAVIIITAAWMVGYQQAVTCQVEVTGINSGSPAEQAGLQPGDLILQVDAEPIDGCGELTTYISARKGQQVTLSVKRGVSILIPWQAWICAQVDRCALVAQASDQTLQIPIVPRTDGQYNPAREGPLGVTVLHHATSWETQQVGLIDALIGTAGIIQTMVAGMLSLPAALVSGAALAVLGPIGISQAGSEAIEQSIRYGTLFPILMLIGQVSVAVGLTNLLPLPALDGGRLLFIVVEWLRGRRVEPRKEMIVHLVGLGLLVLVALLVSYGDIMRLINNQSILK
jgi:regulator of sigma E protease